MNPWWAHAATVLLGVVSVTVGGPLVKALFRRVDRRPVALTGSSPAPPPTGATAADSQAPVIEAAQQLRGGAWIGMLERLAVYAALVAGWPEGIAIVLGVKGLARYPELRATTSGTAERFIIGTFTSVLWAAACAGVAVWVEGLAR